MRIDVGIINYNGGSELSECVRSLLAQTEKVRVLVYDNASADNSIQLLKEQGLDCKVIENSENLGYAGACNGLLENMDADIQVLCNMDLEFDPTWAENLLKCFDRHPEAGSIASLVMEKSGDEFPKVRSKGGWQNGCQFLLVLRRNGMVFPP